MHQRNRRHHGNRCFEKIKIKPYFPYCVWLNPSVLQYFKGAVYSKRIEMSNYFTPRALIWFSINFPLKGYIYLSVSLWEKSAPVNLCLDFTVCFLLIFCLFFFAFFGYKHFYTTWKQKLKYWPLNLEMSSTYPQNHII